MLSKLCSSLSMVYTERSMFTFWSKYRVNTIYINRNLRNWKKSLSGMADTVMLEGVLLWMFVKREIINNFW